jgi:radical SAM-linked protein
MDEIAERQQYVRKAVRSRSISVKLHDRRMSLLEGLFSRGDQSLGNLIERVFRLGGRFDGWSDQLQFDLWEQAMEDLDISADAYLRERTFDEALPWDSIDCGVSRDFLLQELQNSLSGTLTEDCRNGACRQCGVCDFKEFRIEKAHTEQQKPCEAATGRPGQEPEPHVPASCLRMIFRKLGRARLLSHLEITEALIRAIKKTGSTFVFTEGFHPHPKISFAFATAVGMESEGEYADIHLRNLSSGPGDLAAAINSGLPEGLEVVEMTEILPGTPSLSDTIRGFVYEITVPERLAADVPWPRVEQKAAEFREASSFSILREKKGRKIVRDIRPLVEALELSKECGTLRLRLLFGSDSFTAGYSAEFPKQLTESDGAIFEKLHVSAEARQKIFGKNALAFWGIK